MARRRKVRVPRAAAPDSGWAFRFLARLASFGWDEALVDGREAALGGAVVSFEVAKSGARSEFRRADGHCEEARLSLKPLPPAALRKALSSMAARARFAADLLAGRIPDDVEAAFAGTGRTLLPATADELVALCTCDAPLPCVHAGAAAVLLGDALADDPFLVFLLRGLPREELLLGLQRARRRPAPSGAARAAARGRPGEAGAVLPAGRAGGRAAHGLRAPRTSGSRPHAPRPAAAARSRGVAPAPRASPRDRHGRPRTPRGLGVAEGWWQRLSAGKTPGDSLEGEKATCRAGRILPRLDCP
jgi:uncharacterized Zn finger protein